MNEPQLINAEYLDTYRHLCNQRKAVGWQEFVDIVTVVEKGLETTDVAEVSTWILSH